MSFRLACDLPDRIAAIGPVAAADGTLFCGRDRAVPVIALNGTEDVLVNYTIAAASVESWAQANGCSLESDVVYEQGDVICKSYAECGPEGESVLCTVDEGGHTWPGAIDLMALDPEQYPWAGKTTQNLDGSAAIWEFFSRHHLRD